MNYICLWPIFQHCKNNLISTAVYLNICLYVRFSNVKNPLIVSHCPFGYVLKILNSLDSKMEDVVDAQNQILLYLGKY